MKVAPVPFYISLEVPENLSVLFEQKISVLHIAVYIEFVIVIKNELIYIPAGSVLIHNISSRCIDFARIFLIISF